MGTPLTRTVRCITIASAALALTAPAAQARVAGFASTGAQTHVSQVQLPPDRVDRIGSGRGQTALQAPTVETRTTGTGFDWGDASIGAAFATALVGLGITGVRLGQRRTAQA